MVVLVGVGMEPPLIVFIVVGVTGPWVEFELNEFLFEACGEPGYRIERKNIKLGIYGNDKCVRAVQSVRRKYNQVDV